MGTIVLIFAIGVLVGYLLAGGWEKTESEAAALRDRITSEVEGYLRNKPLLNEAERKLLALVSQLHDLD